jgi:hypothetical protein
MPRVEFPMSVIINAMLDSPGDSGEWGEMPPVVKGRKNRLAFEGTEEQMSNLFDLVIERCHCCYTCNDDREASPIAAWHWLLKNYRDEVKKRAGQLRIYLE